MRTKQCCLEPHNRWTRRPLMRLEPQAVMIHIHSHTCEKQRLAQLLMWIFLTTRTCISSPTSVSYKHCTVSHHHVRARGAIQLPLFEGDINSFSVLNNMLGRSPQLDLTLHIIMLIGNEPINCTSEQ